MFPSAAAALLLLAPPSGEARVAVAANFTAVARELAARFEADTGFRVRPSFGSTGQLYAQIVQGAPFDVFLAADAERPARLAAEGRGDPPIPYAHGRLVLWSPDPERIRGPEALHAPGLARIALANPETAPYGAAALRVLERLGVSDPPRRILGNNVAQAFQFVRTGNAGAGLLALSQVPATGSRWEIPESLHPPLRQDALLLRRGRGNPAAEAFLRFLGSGAARAIIERAGYRTP